MKLILSLFMALFSVTLVAFSAAVVTDFNLVDTIVGTVVVTGVGLLFTGGTGLLMADYAATALLQARARIEDSLAGRINQNELRQPATGGFRAHRDSTPRLILGGEETISKLRQGTAQATKVPVLDQLSGSVDANRACGASEEGDSALVSVTYQTVSKGFVINEDLHDSNDIKFGSVLMHDFDEIFKKLHLDLDTKAIANLEAAKSAVNDGSLNTFNAGTDTMEVSLANKDNYFGSIMTEMGENDFDGEVFNVHSLAQNFEINRQRNQGAGNDQNLNWQFEDFVHYGTNKVTSATAAQSTSYIFVPGTVGVISWIKPKNRRGVTIGTDTWTTINDPFVPGLVWELKIKQVCKDNSGTIVGTEDDLQWQYRVSAEFAFMTAYTSDTDTGIYKYQQQKA